MFHSSLHDVPIICEIVPIVCEIVLVTIGVDVMIFKNVSIQKNLIFIFKTTLSQSIGFLCACNKHLVVMHLIYSNAPNPH
jgi:hypothetical protein